MIELRGTELKLHLCVRACVTRISLLVRNECVLPSEKICGSWPQICVCVCTKISLWAKNLCPGGRKICVSVQKSVYG